MRHKTKVAILEKFNSPLVIDEVEIPELECGQVLVKIHKSGICGRQIGEISGAKGPDKYLPHLLGHEAGGVIVDISPGVSHVKKGDSVVMHWRKGIGIDARPPRYRRGNGFVGAGQIATFAEMAVISENRLTPIEDDIDYNIAALMGCAVTTGFGLINNEAQLKIGQSIAVIGCGGVGLNVIQGAKLVSAYPIAAIDIKSEKLNMAQEFGANGLINFKYDPEGIRFIKDFDVIVECTGQPNLINLAYQLTRPGGKTIMVGQPWNGQYLGIENMADNFTGKILMDSQGGLTNPTEDIPRYLELYRKGKLKLDGLITHEFPLDEINEAIEIVRSGEAGRVMLDMT